ncbi:MAG: DUF1501 domain-containing protein [Myxococcota bacterium]
MTLNRRSFLQGVSASGLTAASVAGLGTALSGFSAQAADTSGYKALVCVFLEGGIDNHDTIIPYDAMSYDKWAGIRSGLLGTYGQQRARESILPLTPQNAGAFGDRSFALPQEMAGLHRLFQAGNAAIVGNVGPLVQPVSRATFQDQTARVPARLFSHNDQQSTWMGGAPEGAQHGWGGLFADAMIDSGANSSPEFSVITSGGAELFVTGRQAVPYQIDPGGASRIEFVEEFRGSPFFDRLRSYFRSQYFSGSNLAQRDIAAALQASFDSNEKYNSAAASGITLNASFPAGEVGGQLRAVAQSIAIRDTLTVNRQVFIVGMGGYDTHGNQAGDLPMLQSQLDVAISAFFEAISELGLANDVTLFTASDFGRSLAVNGDGTDHGWGGHQFVVGGAVNGNTIYGTVPPSEFGHELDAGGGRLIPTVSVEQFAAPLGRWFGLNESEVASALPNLSSFADAPLNFV